MQPAQRNKKKILITGASGFIGRALVERWTGSGAPIKACVRHPVRDPRWGSRVELACLPHIDRFSDWAEHLKDVSHVVHLAGKAHATHRHAGAGSREYDEINHRATEALMRACQQERVERFVFLSSVKVHGDGHPCPYLENDPLAPSDAYALSKQKAEEVIQGIAAQGETEWVILRPPLVYGPGVKANYLALLRLVNSHLPLPLAALNNRRSMIYVHNLADAIISASESPSAAGQVFLVSDGSDLTVTDLISEIARAMKRKPILFPFPPKGLEWLFRMSGRGQAIQKLTRPLTVDIAKIKRQMGWRPPISIKEGIAATVNWYKNQLPEEINKPWQS
jgi:nucleoside-diphosphate-sugar epimerase